MSWDNLIARVPEGWGWSVVAKKDVDGELEFIAAVCDWGERFYQGIAARPAEALKEALAKLTADGRS